MEIKIWEINLKDHKKVEIRQTILHLVYTLLLGQCSQLMRTKLEAHQDWVVVDETTDVIGLLQILQHCMGDKQTHQYPLLTLMEAEEHVYTFHQAQNMTDHQYHDKFKDLLEMAWRLGSTIGIQKKRVDAILARICVDPKNIKASKKMRARDEAKQQYIALMFLMHSNKCRYGDLINNIKNEYTHGSETFPQSLQATFMILINYKTHQRLTQHGAKDGNMLYNDHKAADESERDSG